MSNTKAKLRSQSDFDDRIPRRDIVTVTSNGQTVFAGALSTTPVNGDEVRFYVNGLRYYEGIDYTIASQQLTWIHPTLVLDTLDDCLVEYFPS